MATRSIMKARRTARRVLIAAAAIIGCSSVTVSADTTSRVDPMRCEALKLKCDSRYHMCLSRCDSIADRRAIASPEVGEEVRATCSNGCEIRHRNAELRLEQRPVCNDPAPAEPNPQACASKLLWVKANYMRCMANCHARFDQRPEFDCDSRVSECYDVYHAETDAMNADPICGNGPAETVPMEEAPESCGGTD